MFFAFLGYISYLFRHVLNNLWVSYVINLLRSVHIYLRFIIVFFFQFSYLIFLSDFLIQCFFLISCYITDIVKVLRLLKRGIFGYYTYFAGLVFQNFFNCVDMLRKKEITVQVPLFNKPLYIFFLTCVIYLVINDWKWFKMNLI